MAGVFNALGIQATSFSSDPQSPPDEPKACSWGELASLTEEGCPTEHVSTQPMGEGRVQ